MRTRLVGFALLALGAAHACRTEGGQYRCTSDVECERGLCEVTGYCSFEDQRCESGRRYGALSGELSNECLSAVLGTTGVGSSSGSTSTSGANTETGPVEPAESTSEGGDSTPADDSTEDSTSAVPGSTESAPPDNGSYGPCESDEDCELPSRCISSGLGEGFQCVPPCTVVENCPPYDELERVCLSENCALRCSDDGVCPDGLMCLAGFCIAP